MSRFEALRMAARRGLRALAAVETDWELAGRPMRAAGRAGVGVALLGLAYWLGRRRQRSEAIRDLARAACAMDERQAAAVFHHGQGPVTTTEFQRTPDGWPPEQSER